MAEVAEVAVPEKTKRPMQKTKTFSERLMEKQASDEAAAAAKAAAKNQPKYREAVVGRAGTAKQLPPSLGEGGGDAVGETDVVDI